MDDEKREECGIVAIVSLEKTSVPPLIFRALHALQHRGQDAAGFAVWNGKSIDSRKGIGLVFDAFKPEDLTLHGIRGIGHTRYPTSGKFRLCDVQPFVIENMAIAHNGHIGNAPELRKELEKKGFSFQSSVDSEIILLLMSEKISAGIEAAVSYAMSKLDGGYSVVGMWNDTVFAFRDPHGIRPLVFGKNKSHLMFASESCALDVCDIEYAGTLKAGELVYVDSAGTEHRKQIQSAPLANCMFEYVYFSRPDSKINDLSILTARENLGKELAKEHPARAEVVISVPDTSRTAAQAYADALSLPHKEGLIKNRYIGRTFIMPEQAQRKDAVRLKLNPVREVIQGKSIVLIDDSIVRGTTLKEIVSLVKKAGAKEVHVRITCPPIKAPCFYGVDMSTYNELIAHKKSVAQIGAFLGADSIGYLSIEGLTRAVGKGICTGCLTGKYPTSKATELAKDIRGEQCGCG